jgi:hypothetical protein
VHRRLIAVFLLAALGLGAADKPRHRPAKRRWWLSIAALGSAAFLDAYTSWGRRELNPMLRSPGDRFNARGLALKSSIVGASCGLQWLLLERKPRATSTVTGVNFGLAAWTAGVVVHNLKN